MRGAAVDIKQLKALVTVVEAGSVTRAAELLRVVQPAVTRQIQALEHELGVPLFERTRQGMRPTPAGVTMAERARRALMELDRARSELAPAPDAVTGIVSVGLLESTAGLLAEPLVTAVLRAHPGIELRIVTAYSGHLQGWLDDGDLDVSLLYSLTDIPSLNVRTLVREKLWAIAPLSDGLSAERPVPVASLAAHRLVMPAPGHALRILIDQAVAQAQIEIDVAVQTNSMDLQQRFVRGGLGWTVLPGVGIPADPAAGSLSAAPLSEPEVWRSIAIGTPRAARLTPAARIVARELVQQVGAAASQGRWLSARIRDEAEPQQPLAVRHW
jgi:LysR family transcriptional regulator, nitrogen assimilation regulatory protein